MIIHRKIWGVISSCICITTAICQINVSYMDNEVRPQDDFYNYVNGNWMKKTEIPADRGRWGSFDQLREHTDTFSLSLIKELMKTDFSEGSDEQKVKDFYKSITNLEYRQNQGLTPLKPYFDKIDKLKTIDDLYVYLVELSMEGRDPFVGIWVYNHMKRSDQNAVYLGNIELGLGRDYYQKNDEKSKETQELFKVYINKLYSIIYPNESKINFGAKYVEFEKEIAQFLLNVEDIRDSEQQYNPVAVKDFNKLISNFPLAYYLKAQNYSVDTVTIGELKYYKNLDKFLRDDNIGFLRKYLKIYLLNNSMELLTKELDSIKFDFYGKTLSGQQEQRSIEKRALNTLNNSLGEILGKVYVKKAFSQEAKQNAEELVSYLKKSYKKHISELAWMSDTTKQKALYKLDKILVKIGYPDKWKDYTNVDIKSIEEGGSYFGNMREVSIWNQIEMLNKVGKPVDRTEWGMSPQTVNAYYNPSNNEIVFPAAILQKPFYDFYAGPAVNFGGIGAVIGHEISHGFDDGGSQYDGDGNLRNWWTEDDKKKFKVATEQLIAQYNNYEPIPKMFVNGKFTLGENIADLAGVSVAYDAFRLYKQDKPHLFKKPQDGFKDKDFFLSWATIWRSKMREKALVNMIKTDPHSPGYYRAIGPLVNLDPFYELFNVKEGDKLYKKPEDRIVIW